MPNKPQRLYQAVAGQLEAFIEKSKLQPGDRLPGELALSKQFAVSRNTVREAMLALEIAGHIEIRGGSGAYIRQGAKLLMDAGPGPFELLHARILVEGEIAAEAALQASGDDLGRIEASFVEMRRLVALRENAQVADREFHVLIAEAARNTVLTGFVDGLWSGIFSPMFHNLSLRAGLQHHQQMTLDDHARILHALKERNPQAARGAMRAHLRHVQDILQGGDEMPGAFAGSARRKALAGQATGPAQKRRGKAVQQD